MGVCPTSAINVRLLGGGDNGGLFPGSNSDASNGQALKNWLDRPCDGGGVLTPKSGNSLLQSEAAKWGMTAEVYIADKLGLIAESGGYAKLGSIARAAGWVGIVYGSYTAVVAVSDGNLTANELLGMASTTLGVIALVPGVGTAVGLSGLALIAAGSLVLGLMSNSDLGQDTTIANWDTRSLCN